MMMPANFSAVSENEMTYVMGGAIGEYLMAPMGKAEWKQFSTNLTTIVGNKFLQGYVDNTLGKVFDGTYTPGDVFGAFGTKFTSIWNDNYTAHKSDDTLKNVGYGALGALNIGLNIVGNLAAIYNLGFGTAKNVVNDTYGDSTKFEF